MTHPMARDPNFTADFVRSILDYDPETGVFRWKSRPECSDLRNSLWTGRIAGTKVCGYIQIAIYVGGRTVSIYAHRLAWLYVYGAWPEQHVDHIDRDKTNNRIANLRAATVAENARNRRKRSDNKTGFTGVAFRANRNKWEGRITLNGKTVWRHTFDTAIEANAARMAALPRFHGDFARCGA
jgi:hypothetical protein